MSKFKTVRDFLPQTRLSGEGQQYNAETCAIASCLWFSQTATVLLVNSHPSMSH